MERKITFDHVGGTVSNVVLARRDDVIEDNSKVYAAGWGVNPEQGPYETKIYKVYLKTVNSADCARDWYDSVSEYKKHVVCATGHNRDTCEV